MQTNLTAKIINFSNWNLWLYPVQFVIGFISSVYVTRVVGANQYGELSVYLALTTLLAIFSDLGITGGITKFFPEYQKNGFSFSRFALTVLLLRLTLFALLAGLLFLSPGLFVGDSTLKTEYFSIILITVGCQVFADVFVGGNLALLRNKQIQIAQTIGGLSLPILIFLFATYDLARILWLYAATAVIRTLVLAVSFDWRGFFKSGQPGHPAHILARTVQNGTAKVLFMVLRYGFDLGFLFLVFAGPRHLRALGFVSLANRLLAYMLNLSAFPLNQMQDTLFAHLYAEKENHVRIQKVFNLLSKYTAVFTVPLLMILVGYGHIMIGTFYGKEFLPADSALSFLALAMACATLYGAASKMLIQFEEHRFFNFLSISLLSAMAALLAVCKHNNAFEAAFYGLTFLRLGYHLATHEYLTRIWKLKLDSSWIWRLVVCNLAWLLPVVTPLSWGLHPIVQMLLSIILYLALHKTLGLFTAEDKSYFRQLKFPARDKILAWL